ncbi:DUF4258 domain-containing protein [Pinisolibacter aquiterrae]|uniref:DUF4258 domain-containing protein n=1 Tax=Pinisolibacter aquiterrae TaxID=2815579 RepID=UPI001C3E594D|nr:DUF4258 domain-containing protein [Pinisolibacter aquiterrae]MCC8234366.1 DUF4258 domain-containing protein [Pinisolibacter aquiterrae]
MTDEQPDDLDAHEARRIVRDLATNSARVSVLPHAQKRKRQRRISFEDILRVLRGGTVTEGPYIAPKSGWWRFNVTGRSAGDEVTCVVEIEWKTKLLVVTVF